jgi:hypothetical protein
MGQVEGTTSLLVNEYGDAAMTPLPTAPRPLPPRLRIVLADMFTALCRDFFGSYCPERHYMRGPGPAWQAKHAA